MRAAVFMEPYKFSIVQMDKPVPQKGEVLIRIMAAGICGSDIGPFTGKDIERRRPGIIMGHEAAGMVEMAGEGVNGWRPGDRVAINPQIYCNTCIYCRTGKYNLCNNMQLIGSSKRKFLHGAMCEYICISEKQLVRLPDNVSYEKGALLDPVGNAIRVIRRGHVGIGDKVVVLGCGTIGLLILQTAGIAGADKIIAVSRSGIKSALALEAGASHFVDSSNKEKALNEINEYTHGKGADVVIDAAGFTDTYDFAVSCCKKGGRVVALGYNGTQLNFPLTNLIFKEIQLIGSTGFAEESFLALEYLSNGRVKLDKIISKRFPLEKTQNAFEAVNGGNEIKVIIKPDE